MAQHRQFTTSYIKLLQSIHAVGGVPCEKYPQLFYPEDFPDPEHRAIATRTAKKVCQQCPIIEQCFEYALETNQEFGIWGGTSPNER
ncbi:MAG: WhiB family transcriptional regulator [Actinobacteria bacterium]|nr:WhiB family transcriptional regulator [Actinomycetota bacterium]